MADHRPREHGKDWLYFAWDRDNENGSGFIAYEFMQNAVPAGCTYATATEAQLIANCNPWDNRRAGDFMILWDQQGGSLDLFLRTWSGTGDNLTLSAPVALNDAVSQAAYSADGFRGEAAVNLTDTVFGGSTACRTFANTIPSTVTGNSDTADYKDTILQTAPPITNCTSTIVTTPKVVTDTRPTRTRPPTCRPAAHRSAPAFVAVADSAVVGLIGGTATPAGSVTFTLCKVDAPGCVRHRWHDRRLDEPDGLVVSGDGPVADGVRHVSRPLLLACLVQRRLGQRHPGPDRVRCPASASPSTRSRRPCRRAPAPTSTSAAP